MIPKPSSCIGCPFYDKGAYFTPDRIVPDARVLFIAQNPGPDEEKGLKLVKRYYQGSQYFDEKKRVAPQPLIGATGKLFDERFLPLTGLKREEVSLANAIRCRPGAALGMRSDDLPPITSAMKLESSKADIVKALKYCRDTHLHVPASTELIVTMGRHAMFALTGIQHEEVDYGRKQGVIESWRGYGVDTDTFEHFGTVDTDVYHPLHGVRRILFTLHIAALFKGLNKKFYHATLEDFHKIKLLLAHRWPLKTLPTWSNIAPEVWPAYAAFDTEYTLDTGALTRWSLCDIQSSTHLYCVESDDTPHTGIPIQPSAVVLLQNAHADLRHIARITDLSQVRIHDMMHAHMVLWTGEPHNLNYIASKYGSLNRYKHLSKSNPQMYSAFDAWEPAYMWRHHFLPHFRQDTQSWNVYTQYRLGLIPIIEKAQQTGARVNTERLSEVQAILEERLASYQAQAQALTGDPTFNLGGHKHMMHALYGDRHADNDTEPSA